MKLTKIRITKYQSVQDSTEFEVGSVTCLVGKNEAGKTAILRALYRLNPITETGATFNATHDYPRSEFIAYEANVESGGISPASVVHATFELESDDISAIHERFGVDSLTCDSSPTVALSRGYDNKLYVRELPIDERVAVRHQIASSPLPQQLASELQVLDSTQEIRERLTDTDSSDAIDSLRQFVEEVCEQGVATVAFDKVLRNRLPKFMYFDEYSQMKGEDNLDALIERVNNNELEDSDYPLLGLINLAGLKLEQLLNLEETETLIARLEAAGNELTRRVLRHWSQNRHIRLKFDIRPAHPNDGPGMDSGTNLLGRVEDTRHPVTTPLRTRSKGFIWFFSFLAWYSNVRSDGSKLILLLDEPGLSLHAKAQEDLLKYFENELAPHHQLIYTTHSPFMVDPTRFDRVRIVQDLSIEHVSTAESESDQGTKVISEVLEATPDSLFPLQGALGYEIHQSLFVGPNSLVVEGVSDLLYLQAISAALQRKGRIGLSSDWTITPVGGADKVSTFVALLGAQSKLNIAVLIDFQKMNRQGVEHLYKSKLLKRRQVLTYSDFTTNAEADIEDMFDPQFYLKLVNAEYKSDIELGDLIGPDQRIVRRIQSYVGSNPLPDAAKFNHYRPARLFSTGVDGFESELSDASLARFQTAFDALNGLLD